MELARTEEEIFDKLENLYKLYKINDNIYEERERLKIAIYSILWTCSHSVVDVLKANDRKFDMYMESILKYRDLNLLVSFEKVV